MLCEEYLQFRKKCWHFPIADGLHPFSHSCLIRSSIACVFAPPGRYLLLEDCMGNTPSVVWRRLPLTPLFEASHGMVRNHRNANRRCAVGRGTRSCQCGTLPCSIMKNAPPPRMAAVDTRSNNRGHHGRKKLKSQSVDVAPRRNLLKRQEPVPPGPATSGRLTQR